MVKREIYMQLFNISINTYYLWKKQERPIINLLEKYFTKEDLEEFLENGKISKMEKAKFVQEEVLEINKIKYFNSFSHKSLRYYHQEFIIFYFKFLVELAKANNNNSDLDEFIFSKNFYAVSFNQLVNTFLIAHLDDLDMRKKMIKTFIIYKNFDIFNSWDSYMLLFLKECLDNHFKNLYDSYYGIARSPAETKEAVYHIYGFYIFYQLDNKVEDIKKIELLNKTFKKYEEQSISPFESIQPDIDRILNLIDIKN